MAATIANISIKAFLDTTGIFIGAKKAEKGISAFAKGIGDKLGITTALANPATAAVAAVGAAAAVAGYQINEAFKRVDEIDKLAERFDVTADSIQRMSVAASLGEVDFDTLMKGVQKMQMTIGSGGMSLDKRLAQVADELSAIEDPGKRAARSVEIFGKAGIEMQNLLLKGGSAISEATALIDDFGIGLTDFDTQQITRANDAWDKMAVVLDGLWQKVAAQLAPIVADTLEFMLDALKDIGVVLSSQGITWDRVGSVARMAMNGLIGAGRTALQVLDAMAVGVLKVEAGFYSAASAAALMNGNVVKAGEFGVKAKGTLDAVAKLEKSIANSGGRAWNAFTGAIPMGEERRRGGGMADNEANLRSNAPLALRNSVEAMRIISGSRQTDYDKSTAKNTERAAAALDELVRNSKTRNATPQVALNF